MAREVSKTPGAIGYVELTYALANSLPVGLVKNRDGEFPTPGPASVAAAAAAQLAVIPADLRFTLTDAPGPDSYPLAGTTWAVVYAKQPPDKAAALRQFLTWATTTGQAAAPELNYAPLPAALADRARAAIATIGGNDE